MAFADPRLRGGFALPFYRLRLSLGRGVEKTIDAEAHLITKAKPHHVCLLLEPPRGGLASPPEGVPAAQPLLGPEGVITHIARSMERLEELAARGGGSETRRSLLSIIAGLFLPREPLGEAVFPGLEYRLAYSLCLDAFGGTAPGSWRILGSRLVWRVYRAEAGSGRFRVVNPETGGLERRLTVILAESEEARGAILRLLGATS
ncbi:hypothetical protein [Stetteria hydrogenophila]